MDYAALPVHLRSPYEIGDLEPIYEVIHGQNNLATNGLHILREHGNLIMPQLMDNNRVPLFHPVPVPMRYGLKWNPAQVANAHVTQILQRILHTPKRSSTIGRNQQNPLFSLLIHIMPPL
jgi:hypothetical protein